MPREQITLRLDARALATLRTRAAGEHRSISDLVNTIVVKYLRDQITPADGFEVILPALNAAVHQSLNKAVDGLNSRLKHLLSKTLVSAYANRLAVFQLLAAEFGAEAAKKIYDEATLEAERRLEPTLKRLSQRSLSAGE